MKKIFTLVLALCSLSAWAHDFEVDGVYYNSLDGNNVAVTYKGNNASSYSDEYSGEVIIPSTVTYYGTTYSVTSIGYSAFEDCSSLTSVTIPNSVTSIGDRAFRDCSSLTSVTIPNSVTSIEKGTFEDCSSLTSITIPSSVTHIGDQAFYSCDSFTSITCLGTTPPTLGTYVFDGTKLSIVYIPDNTLSAYQTAWGNEYVFVNNENTLTLHVAMPGTLSDLIFDAGTRPALVAKLILTGTLNDADFTCMRETMTSLVDVDLSGITNTYGVNFRGKENLVRIILPTNLTSIGDGAFSGCTSLTSVTIGNSVTSIGDDTFYNCDGLTSITIPNSVTSIGREAFRDCSSLISITIGNSVTSIGDGAFYACSSLTSITIPNSVTSIVGAAFDWCPSLTSVTINSDAIVNKTYSYSYNISAIFGSQVTEYIIGDDVKGIGDYAFRGCSSLTSITIPSSVTHIGDQAFRDCSFTSITCEATTPPTLGSSVFYGVSKSIPVYVPCGSEYIYKAAFGWKEFTNIQEPQVEYAIQVSTSNSQMGSAIVVYNTSCGAQISATANYGYHFVQWSDGNTDNPRTLTLTQDTVLTAEFAQTYSGKCGDNLYWKYDDEARQLTISGFGEMYNYTTSTQPWVIFKRRFVTLSLSDEITKIGEYAFDGCVRIREITLGSKMEELADYSFTNCSSLQDIYCYAQRPPYEDRFLFVDNHYAITVHVPCDYLTEYQMDYIWQNFPIYECISSNHVETDDVVVTPGTNDVTITWPTEEGADTYTIVIKKDGEVVCTLTFNADGQLLNIAFAPGRDSNHPAQYAEAVANGGYRFTVTGLEEGTHYTYDITVKDASNQTIATYSGEFTTKGGTTTDMDNILSPVTTCQKVMRNGQLIIIRDGVEYNAMGQEIH